MTEEVICFALAPLFSFPAPPSSTPTYPLQWGNADGGGIFGDTYRFTGGGGAFGLEVAAAGVALFSALDELKAEA
ncbi:hypothetical protein K438DRAFT_1877354 [Mycena galopus ATCC 62051]|nr:hypothetical protein K438DRAFT_1877354 [Mycena galopus ATCC 62051]